jgi:hypothetical protein
MINGCVRKNLEGYGRCIIEALSRHLPGGTEENHEILSHDSLWPGRDSN